MKILVTGGAGFIGSHLVDALINNEHDVVVVDNLSTGTKENLNAKAKFIKLDITADQLAEVFAVEKPKVVFHLAAQIDVRKSVANPVWDAEQNIIGSINLLENCRKYEVQKVIFSSTGGAIYGETEKIPTTESEPTEPISPYGIGKLATEKYLNYYWQVFGLPFTILRYGNVYGPRQNSKGEAGVVAIFCDKLQAGVSPTINGDGKQTRDYVYVGDVVKANLAALENDQVAIFNIGTGVETDVNKLSALIKDAFGAEVEFNHGQAKTGEQQRSCLSFAKAKSELGWEPLVAIDSGIKNTVNWFRSLSL
ncbi:MAG: NAD-dependent epimerase/dehydratase family protein [Patescibacteria group bacterium]|nr:NAD-dependent epimerase/dehydratase family protein [Patescibacteria group bacterium]